MLQSLEQCNERCTNCLCDGPLQIDFCLQLLNIYHKAIKSKRKFLAFLPKRSTEGSKAKTCFPFVSFPDSYLVGSSSSARAKLEPHGVISNASVRCLCIVKLSYVSPRFPTEKNSWELRLFLKNYSWYSRNTSVVDS